MTEIAVVYGSRYGTTKQYAQWLAEELGADLYSIDHVYKEKLDTYDILVYGGGLYYGGIKGFGKLKRLCRSISDKKLVVFTVGMSPTDNQELAENVKRSNLTPEMRGRVAVFPLKGAVDYAALSPFHRIFMKSYQKQPKGELDRKALEPIAARVRELMEETEN